MRTKPDKQKKAMLLLTALVIAVVLVMPRLVILLYLKHNSDGAEYNPQASRYGFIAKALYTYIIAVVLLWVNTSRKKLVVKNFKIDLGKFYIRMIVNILLFAGFRIVTMQYNFHAGPVIIIEKFYDFIFNISMVLEFILCILASEIYMLMASNQEMGIRNNALQKANAEATFEVLKNQVNPHFLFNSLNTINAMIGNENDAAKTFVNNMSLVYRYALSSMNKPVVTLAEEMEIAMAYIHMLHARHRENLRVEVMNDNRMMESLLPPMSLQILLENAIKHNVVSVKHPLLIKIQTRGKSVSVSNTILEKKIKPPSTGTGLYNLNQRYRYLCQQEITISKMGSNFEVSVPLLKLSDVKKCF